MIADVRIGESLDGGDAVLLGNDLEFVDQLKNQVLFGLFGGNVEESTPTIIDTENRVQRFDFWGNGLFHPDEPEFQFNSNFERSLRDIALNTEGLQRLEQIASNDLSFLSALGDVTVDITLQDVNRIGIEVRIALRPRFSDLVTVAFELDVSQLSFGDMPTPDSAVYESGIYESGIYE